MHGPLETEHIQNERSMHVNKKFFSRLPEFYIPVKPKNLKAGVCDGSIALLVESTMRLCYNTFLIRLISILCASNYFRGFEVMLRDSGCRRSIREKGDPLPVWFLKRMKFEKYNLL